MADYARATYDAGKQAALEATGGPARFQVIVVLAAVLGLDMADKGTVSAMSDLLKQAFHIGNTDIGLLLAVVSFIGAFGTLPAGMLADRMRRKTILLTVLPVWAALMIVSGTATSFLYLILARLGLGAVTAASWPCIASMTGDFFPARERAAIYGLIISGELIGAGFGFFVSGEVSSFIDWRWGFYVMALPSLAVLWAVWRFLPEPDRGTQSWIAPGETDAFRAAHGKGKKRPDESAGANEAPSVRKAVERADIGPREELVLREDPARRSWVWAIRYLMKIPTYLLLVAASTLTYYFFSGLRAFGMIYFTQHLGIAQHTVSALIIIIGIGALAGVITGGRLSEWLLRRGNFNARIVVPAVALLVAAVLYAFGIWATSVWLAVALLTAATAAMAAATAPIYAARLDIIHPSMWGRAESGHMAMRSLFEGGAPLLFGAVSGWLGGGGKGLMWTFLLMLIPMLIASGLVVPARKTYPRDVATAAAATDATKREKQRGSGKSKRQSG
jgi:predicted MFS family arabinose efflux permease